ncbi:MAG: hypothetical protein M1457_11570 [bacterium]|nr:hypothetical protein [bacterium]
MMTTDVIHEALEALRDLGTPEEMKARAEAGLAPASRPKVNGHVHLPPNFSAFDSVVQAVGLAADQAIGVLGVSNYYDYTVYGDFVMQARARGIFPLFGLEIIALDAGLARQGVKMNDPGNPGKLYICGKAITRFGQMNTEARDLLGIIRYNDSARMRILVGRLAEIFAAGGVETGLTEAAVIDMVVARHGCARKTVYLQERHVCQAFQEALFARVPAGGRAAVLALILGAEVKAGPNDAVKIQNEIRSHLLKAGKPAYIEEKFVDLAQARRLILALGGIPCYPTLADGAKPVSPYEEPVETLIKNMKAANLHCAEFIPLRNAPEVLTRYVKAMRAAGIVVTAGTEHNTLDLAPLEPACVGGAPVPDDIKEIFWEGACVQAGHQFMALHGQCGFVDEHGDPNPEFAGVETRIDAFRRLGAAVIESYRRAAI